jgi:preprotein translocase, YajC subunit
MGAQQQSWLTIAVYFGFFLVIFYVLIILPRKRQEKKHKDVLDNLKRGDKIVTIGGMRGEIAKVKEDVFVIKANDDVELEFVKKAVAYKVEDK